MLERLSDLPFCFFYIYNIWVASFNLEQHFLALQVVLERLKQQGLVLNVEKYLFAVSSLEYLGHQVTASSIMPLVKHVEA
jgi:hypothetical protein